MSKEIWRQKAYSRGTLSVNAVEEFAAWAVSKGYVREPVPPKAKYEVLRLRRGKRPPILFHRREASAGGGVLRHITTTQAGDGLVRTWIKERNAKRWEDWVGEFGSGSELYIDGMCIATVYTRANKTCSVLLWNGEQRHGFSTIEDAKDMAESEFDARRGKK